MVVGDVMMDAYDFCYTQHSRPSPERENTRVYTAHRVEKVLGGAGNVAANLASLGVDTTLISICGNDGNYFEIKFEAKNLEGEFDLPSFEGFDIVSGPNQTQNMSFNNGEKNSSRSISFLLKPKTVDVLSIPPAFFVSTERTWESSPRDITILPNPEGIVTDSRIRSNSNIFDGWGFERRPPVKKKKKLKETKI